MTLILTINQTYYLTAETKQTLGKKCSIDIHPSQHRKRMREKPIATLRLVNGKETLNAQSVYLKNYSLK